MSNDALTPHEWKAARRRIVEELGDDVLADKIEDTISYGFKPEEPTNGQLNEWTAREIMDWHLHPNGVWWLDDCDSIRGKRTREAKFPETWVPSEKLGQAYRVIMETEVDVSVDAITHEECGRDVKSAIVVVGTDTVHEGAFDEGEIARKIMLELWRRLERNEP